jgi:hypothetical protein
LRDKGQKRLIDRKSDLAHLKYVDFGSGEAPRLDKAYAAQIAARDSFVRGDD